MASTILMQNDNDPIIGRKGAMFRDVFDKTCWLLLATAIVSLLFLFCLSGGSGNEKHVAAGQNKALERELAYRARVELISKLYAPIENLRKEGNNQTALLKLDELIRKYPGEAHGYIIQGEILRSMGALDEAVSSYVEGVKLNGDYVDSRSPLSQRAVIQSLVDEGMKNIGRRSAAGPGNQTLAALRQKLNYLKSRLAGGCE